MDFDIKMFAGHKLQIINCHRIIDITNTNGWDVPLIGKIVVFKYNSQYVITGYDKDLNILYLKTLKNKILVY